MGINIMARQWTRFGKPVAVGMLLFALLPVALTGKVSAQNAEKAVNAVPQYDTSSILNLLEDGNQLADKNPEEALQDFVIAAERSRYLKYSRGIALANAKMAKWYFGSNTDKTIDYGRQALHYFEIMTLPSTEEKAEVHLLLAEAFDEQGRQDSSAYYYYLLGSEIEAGNISNPRLAVDLYTKLAIFWINLDYGSNESDGYFQTIKRFVEKAKMAAVSIKDSADAVTSIFFLQGAYYHALKKFDSARYYYSSYLVEREKIGQMVLARKISTLTNITDTYLQQNRPSEAMQEIARVEALMNAPQQTRYLAFYRVFTSLLKAKALYQQQQYAPAISLLNKALQQLKATGAHLRAELLDAYKTLAGSYEASGDYRNALVQKNNYISFYDSLMKKDKIDMINRLEMRYRMVEKDKVVAEQKLKIAAIENRVRSRNYFIAGISFLAFFTAFAFVLWRRKNMHKQRLQQEKIDNLQQKMEIERLNATIDGEEKERTRIAGELHDGIGSLLTAAKMNFEMVRRNSQYEHNPDFIEGIKLLEETASGLRETAHNIMPEILMQEGLGDAVKAFCERMTGKGGTVISFQTLGATPNIDAAFNQPVYRIVQELIHNIRKHANAATAIVQMNFHDDGGLDITVEDDGIGMDHTVAKNSNGMGLKNIYERVKQLGGRIDINSIKGKGTSVYMEFEPGKNQLI